ncbi:MAG: dTDP-4-dehydrorhamnose reductase [Hyphomonas sp.]
MILVFGKTGQVARELAAYPDVICLDRAAADLTDPAACAAAIHQHAPRAVINAAAYTAVDKAEEEEALATLINGDSPGAMAVACAARNIPFLHVSTDYVFDGQGTQAWMPSDAIAPINAYGRSKAAGEAAIQVAARPGAQSAILRTSWVFSAHGANFVKTMLRLAESRDAVTVVDDQIGGPTSAKDIAATLMSMARAMQTDPQLGQGGKIYHYAGAPATSWKCFARETFTRAGKDVKVTGIPGSGYPTPAPRPLNSRLDCRALETDFSITQPDWRAALADVIKDLNP